MSIRSVDQKFCSEVSVRNVDQQCFSSKCRADVSIRNVAKKRRVARKCGSEESIRCVDAQVSIRSVEQQCRSVDPKFFSEVSLRSVDQKCFSEVSTKSVAQKCRVDQNC